MNTVEPIRDKDTVIDIGEYLKGKNARNYVMFLFGIYSGLRISDILKLRVRDVRDKNCITLREQKTGKEKKFPINKELQKVIKEYASEKEDYVFLFSNPYANKPLSRQQAYNIIHDAGKKFSDEKLGTHSLRKTFGYHIYQQTHDVAMLMDIFNHDDPSTTLRYIGINQDTKDKIYNKLSFKF